MLIISDFKDYYDVGQKYGIDKSIRYIRKTTIKKYNKYLLHLKEFEKDRNYFEQNNLLKYFNYIKTTDIWFNRNINCSFCPNDLNYGFIIFCGNHHAFLNYNKKCFYSEEEFNNYLKINSKNFYSKYYLNRKQCKYNIDVKQYNIIKYFNNINNLPIDNKIHFKLECPIILFLINRQTNKKIIITNPILSEWEFYKIKDVYTAFQDISMYISGVLGTQSPELTKIDNNTKIHKHGFDVKKSFRKRKK